MKYLIVAAHPDDETLGAGALIHKATSANDTVDVCIMSSEAAARAGLPENGELRNDILKMKSKLKVNEIYYGKFPNIKFNTVDHLMLVQYIESAILNSSPDIIITHHPSDTNNDHLHTSMACQEAIRLFQRRDDVKKISEVWYMECLSSTEWSINNSFGKFSPNIFVEIGKEGVDAKISALVSYRGVMRPFPHPRSEEAIHALAAFRGAQSGCEYAEAFECALRRIVK